MVENNTSCLYLFQLVAAVVGSNRAKVSSTWTMWVMLAWLQVCLCLSQVGGHQRQCHYTDLLLIFLSKNDQIFAFSSFLKVNDDVLIMFLCVVNAAELIVFG